MDYEKEQQQNQEAFKKMVQTMRPDVFIIMEMLDKTRVNPSVIWRVIRHLMEVSEGTGYGTVEIKIENRVATFVIGTHSDRVNENVLQEN